MSGLREPGRLRVRCDGPVSSSAISTRSYTRRTDWGPEGVWGELSFVFPCHALECSEIHFTASCSVIKPLTTSVSPSGHRISTPQPDPGFFRATKVGRCSGIPRICACGGPVQASYPAPIDDEIAMMRSNRRPCRPVSTTPPKKMPKKIMARQRCSDSCAAWDV
jgi:hypothetical protein